MRLRAFLAVLAAVLCALAVGGAAAPRADALSFVDKQVQAGVLLIQNYVNVSGQKNHFVYPTKAMVRKGGGLTAPVWPANPWSGKVMAPGTSRGTYTYTPNADRSHYTLTAHLSSGPYKLSGGMPVWFKAERDTAAKQGALLLQRYIEEYASLNGNVFPAATDVTPAVVGAGYVWPTSPWTGAAMSAGTALGDFSYAQVTGGTSYALKVKLTTGWSTTYGPSAVAAAWSAAAEAQNDEVAVLGGRVIEGYIREFGLLNNASALPAAAVAPDGDVAQDHSFWPINPYDGSPMSAGTGPGDYSYGAGGNGAYSFAVRESGPASHDLSGAVPQQLRTAFDALKSTLTNANIRLVQSAVDRYAADNNGVFPAYASQVTIGYYLDSWPVNPWTDMSMSTDSTLQGGCEYARSGPSYTITAHVAGGAVGDSVDDTWAEQAMSIRVNLKNMCSQIGVQVIKEYVDEWKATHGGTPPTVDELTKTGAAGAPHAWWPSNPWTSPLPMYNVDSVGDFQYTPGAGGAYTLTVRQQSNDLYDDYYMAQ
jgi:hypothetical protein